MKNKLLLSLLMTLCSLSCVSTFAQDINTDGGGLESIRVRFCGDKGVVGGTKTITLTGDAKQSIDVCVYLFNTHNESVTVDVNVVDGTITGDAGKRKACKDEQTKATIGQYATWSGEQQVFELAPSSVTETAIAIDLPDHYAGKFYGCVTAKIHQDKPVKTEGMFAIVNRRGYPFEIIVDGEIVSSVDWQDMGQTTDGVPAGYDVVATQGSLAILHQNGSYYAYAAVTNQGNIPQDITLRLIGDSDEQSKTVLPGERVDFVVPLLDYNWMRPHFRIGADVTATPVIDFESDKITDDVRKPMIQSLSLNQWTLSPSLRRGLYGIAGLLLLCLLLLLGSRRKKKKPEPELVTLTVDDYEKLTKKHKKKKKKEKKKDKKDKKK